MHLTPLRLNCAKLLVAVCFVWPFINASYFFPDSTVEINFLPTFIAIGFVPELFFEDMISVALIATVVLMAAVWGSTDSALRLIIGAVPCLFIVSLYRECSRRGEELIPFSIAYWGLVAFVGFSALQYINFNVVEIIPDWFTKVMTIIVPRYMDTPYDDLGIRGVQGWASEPSSAAMTCFAFCIVAIKQNPKKCWQILFIFAVLTALNKSVYAMLFLVLLGTGCLWYVKRKKYALITLVLFGTLFTYFALHSVRVAELRDSVLFFGIDQEVNREFLRLGQIIYPLSAFPNIYRPVTIFNIVMQPLGLLPLLVGYGSVVGAVLYFRLLFGKFRFSQTDSPGLGLASILVLSFFSSPDFIPIVLAFVYGMAPEKNFIPASLPASKTNWLSRSTRMLAEGGPAIPQRGM